MKNEYLIGIEFSRGFVVFPGFDVVGEREGLLQWKFHLEFLDFPSIKMCRQIWCIWSGYGMKEDFVKHLGYHILC